MHFLSWCKDGAAISQTKWEFFAVSRGGLACKPGKLWPDGKVLIFLWVLQGKPFVHPPPSRRRSFRCKIVLQRKARAELQRRNDRKFPRRNPAKLQICSRDNYKRKHGLRFDWRSGKFQAVVVVKVSLLRMSAVTNCPLEN